MDVIKLKMPGLKRGKIYRREDLLDHICVDREGSNDFDVASLHFTFKLSGRFEHDALSFRLNERMLAQYEVLKLSEFDDQLGALEGTFKKNDALRDSGTALPVPGFR